ncbi:MAG: AAA family ATPase [Oscillospiraceae bacterium]|nr:AAA family ATPase [Oscillospiraceae bacterium]
MIIESIYIEKFGGLINFIAEFGKGVNIIEGNNEAGKTTIGAFIKYIFYGFKDKRERSLYTSWNKDGVSGSMVVELGGERYRIERECTHGGNDSARIIDLNANVAVFKDLAPQEVFIKVPQEVFEHTVFVRQADNGRVDGKGFGEAIENLLYSADESVNTNKALKRLDDARTVLLHKNHKGGRIFELETEIDSLRVKLDQAIEANKNVITKESALHDMTQKLSDNEDRFRDIGGKIKQYEAYTRIKQYNTMTELKQKIAVSQYELDNLKREYKGNTNFLPDQDYIVKLRGCENIIAMYEREINKIKLQVSELETTVPEHTKITAAITKYGGEEKILADTVNYMARRRNFMAFGIIFGVTTALAIVIAYFIMLFNYVAGAFVLILGIALFIGCLMSFVTGSKQNSLCNKIYLEFGVTDQEDLEILFDKYNSDIINIKKRRETLQAIQKTCEEFSVKLDQKIKERENYLKMWDKQTPLLAISDAEKYLSTLKDRQHDLDKLTTAHDTISSQISYDDDIEDLQKIIAGKNFENVDIRPMLREFEFLEKTIATLKENMHDSEKQVISLKNEALSPSVISNKISELTRKSTDLRVCHDAYLMAYEKLTEASVSLRESVSPKLSEYSSRLIEKLTDGKYKTLGIGHDLDIEYETGGQTRSSEYMSAGTLDVAYISLRFALINLLYRDIQPPMIFDESFARLDDIRLKNVMKLILSTEFQILMFTSQKRDAQIMDSVGKYDHIRI